MDLGTMSFGEIIRGTNEWELCFFLCYVSLAAYLILYIISLAGKVASADRVDAFFLLLSGTYISLMQVKQTTKYKNKLNLTLKILS